MSAILRRLLAFVPTLAVVVVVTFALTHVLPGDPAAFFVASLWSLAAMSISRNMSRRLLEAAPSVPRPTFTPAFTIAGTGAVPLANFMFDCGQWATPTLRAARILKSSPFVHTAWAASTRSSSTPRPSR